MLLSLQYSFSLFYIPFKIIFLSKQKEHAKNSNTEGLIMENFIFYAHCHSDHLQPLVLDLLLASSIHLNDTLFLELSALEIST